MFETEDGEGELVSEKTLTELINSRQGENLYPAFYSPQILTLTLFVYLRRKNINMNACRIRVHSGQKSLESTRQ